MPLDPSIADYSRRLVAKVGFQGLAMVEYKQSPGNNRPILMEINGRPWGSIQLAIASGINYPRHLVEWCLEGKLPPPEIRYNQRITCRRMVGELSHLENLWRGKPEAWPTNYPNLCVSAARIAIPWYPGMRYDDLSLDDPRPGVEGIRDWFRTRLTKARRRSRGAAPGVNEN